MSPPAALDPPLAEIPPQLSGVTRLGVVSRAEALWILPTAAFEPSRARADGKAGAGVRNITYAETANATTPANAATTLASRSAVSRSPTTTSTVNPIAAAAPATANNHHETRRHPVILPSLTPEHDQILDSAKW
jgi:hypothetical protein